MKKGTTCGGAGAGKGGTAATDLLVCFPARQHLALMPKPICSPSRTTMDKAVARRRLPAARHASGGSGGGGRGRGSPMFRGGNKAKHAAQTDAVDDEPQSPKVTCAGQIKVSRPKKPRPVARHGGDGKSWVTEVEETECMHEQRKKVSWLEAIGIRRDALPFLGGALRSLRLKARCFGSLHGAVDSSTDDADDEDDGDGAEDQEADGCGGGSVFSKWLMVLEKNEEPQEQDLIVQEQESDTRERNECSKTPSMPPPNALLLMRCRSAPAKGLLRRGAGEPPAGEEEQEKRSPDAVTGDGTDEEGDKLVFMSTAPDFLKLSIDIAKETWVVGGMDPLARSRSWKR